MAIVLHQKHVWILPYSSAYQLPVLYFEILLTHMTSKMDNVARIFYIGHLQLSFIGLLKACVKYQNHIIINSYHHSWDFMLSYLRLHSGPDAWQLLVCLRLVLKTRMKLHYYQLSIKLLQRLLASMFQAFSLAILGVNGTI